MIWWSMRLGTGNTAALAVLIVMPLAVALGDPRPQSTTVSRSPLAWTMPF